MNPYSFSPSINPSFLALEVQDFSALSEEESCSNEPDTTQDSSSRNSHTSQGGRPMLPQTPLLTSLTTLRNNTPLKKGNLKICLYRGWRNCLRSKGLKRAIRGRINRLFAGSNGLYYSTCLTRLYDYYSLHQSLIDSHLISLEHMREKSHNSHFFSNVYANRQITVCMRLYVEFVFCDSSPEVISEKLGVMCCPAKNHTMECLGKWEELKKYCLDQLFSFN